MSENKHLSFSKVIIGLLILAILAALINCTIKYSELQSGNVSEEGLRTFLSEKGWEVGALCEEVEIVIPATFSAVYEKYNDLQKAQGYDLSKYRTLTAKQFTFEIKNLTCVSGKYASDAVAHVIVFGNAIIGGDICSYELDGCMRGF